MFRLYPKTAEGERLFWVTLSAICVVFCILANLITWKPQ